MRKLLKLVFATLVLLLVSSSRAQDLTLEEIKARALAAENDAKREELVNLETEMTRSMQRNNGTIFRRVFGEDFVGILPSGQVMDKTGWISAMEHSGISYSSFIASDIRVRTYRETAVITCLWSSRGTQGGHSFSRQSRVTHVYIYGGRGWEAVASQETLLPGQG